MLARSALLTLLLAAGPASARPPRLTLLISVDSLGSDLFHRMRPRFTGGFARLVSQGAYYPTARYAYAEPATAAGHATLATGSNPWRHGIVANTIFHRAAARLEPIFTDPGHPALEAPKGLDDVSPQNLLAETLSDHLRLFTQGRGKAVALSNKARSAIALGGKLGSAYWFHRETGKYVTGTYYTKELPRWVKAFNDRKVPDSYFGREWTLSAPARQYTGEDDRGFELELPGRSRVFPHSMKGGLPSPGPQSYQSLEASPFANEVLVQLARAAIDGEALGRDEVPDLLSVSFSAVDLVGHAYGPYSFEMQDVLLRLDRSLGELIAQAERSAGKGQVLVVLSADHGSLGIPEELRAAGLASERLSPQTLQKTLSRELQTLFGVPELVLAVQNTDVFLNLKALSDKRLDAAAVRRSAAQWLGRQPGIGYAVAREELSLPDAGPGYHRALRLGYFPERSGDVLFVLAPYQIFEVEGERTAHGAPYAYDSDVPLLLLGRGVRQGVYPAVVDPVDLAPTVSALLEMGVPAQAEGAVRAEALR